jgi:hypothetical protein
VGKNAIPAVLMLLLAFSVSCSNSPLSPSSRDRAVVVPWGDEDAELMALCLSGELRAPEDLYSIISSDLSDVRGEFGPAHAPLDQIHFRTPWIVSCLIVTFDSVTAASVAAGTYHAWDDLNQTYGLVRTDVGSITLPSHMAVLYFGGRLHPRRLADLYKALPGANAEPNGISGDGSNIYPRKNGAAMTYLFRLAWGDCLSGCISNEYWYFSCTNFSRPVLVGHWKPEPGSGQPLWFAFARQNIELYHGF